MPQIIIDVSEYFKVNDLGLLISRLMGLALTLSAILVFIYLVWGGIEWITSGGNTEKLQNARARITAAVFGLTIVASAFAVMQIIAYFFGIPIFENFPFPRGF